MDKQTQIVYSLLGDIVATLRAALTTTGPQDESIEINIEEAELLVRRYDSLK